MLLGSVWQFWPFHIQDLLKFCKKKKLFFRKIRNLKMTCSTQNSQIQDKLTSVDSWHRVERTERSYGLFKSKSGCVKCVCFEYSKLTHFTHPDLDEKTFECSPTTFHPGQELNEAGPCCPTPVENPNCRSRSEIFDFFSVFVLQNFQQFWIPTVRSLLRTLPRILNTLSGC